MLKPLRAAVAGAGVFGGYHAGKYAQLDGVELVGIFDPDPERAKVLADRHQARAFGPDTLDGLLNEIDVLTLASPADTHAPMGLQALMAGVHLYTEKPLATEIEAGTSLVDLAHEKNLILACGHQERCVFEAMGLLDLPESPLSLEAIRFGTPSERNLDVSVVLDLMIHDLDLGLLLGGAGAEVRSVTARARPDRRVHARGADETLAEVVFASGCRAKFSASRMSETRRREMRVVFSSGEVEIDFLNRTFRNTTPFRLDPDFADTPMARDALGVSVARFVGAVRKERPAPLCSGDEALKALRLALKIDQTSTPQLG